MDTDNRLQRAWKFTRSFRSPEMDQAFIRFVITLGVYLYLVFHKGAVVSSEIYWLIESYILFSGVMVASTFLIPGKLDLRRIAGITFDMLIPCYVMFLAGEHGAYLYLVLWWDQLGYSFRYGKKYMYYGMALCLLGFGSVIRFTPFWAAIPDLAYGLLFGIIVIPWMFVGHMLKRLTTAMEKSEEANRAKTRFVANMSHEMRTPLNGILGTVELLTGTPMSLEQQEYIKTVRASGGALLSLVNDVLDISKIEEGKVFLCLEKMDLHALVKDAASIVGQQIEAKGLSFRVMMSAEVPFLLRGDSPRIRQILTNLLSNSTKFTEHGEICLRVLNAGETDEGVSVRFEVSDTGIGMTEDARDKIFQRFTQADDSITRKYGGTGLGTTISKELVELMGGTIGVESRFGEGSTFGFTIPLAKADGGGFQAAMTTAIPRTDILLVSTSDAVAGPIIGSLVAWKQRHIRRVISTEQAYEYVRRTSADKSSRHVMIIIGERLGEDPRALAENLADSGALETIDLVFVGDRQPHGGAEGLSLAGYCASVETTGSPRDLMCALHFVLPYGNDERTSPFASPDALAGKLKVLVADDNEINQLVIQKILERLGHQVKVVNDGRKALDALLAERFDVAFLDLNMPVMGGLETARRYLAGVRKEKVVPLVALTADATNTSRAACREVGIRSYLTKPFEMKELQAILREVTPKEELAPGPDATAEPDGVVAEPGAGDGGEERPLLDEYAIRQIESLGPTRDFAKNMVARFVDECDRKILDLETADRNDDLAAIRNVAHAFKGTSGQMGALTVMDLCARLERMTREADAEERGRIICDLRHEIARARKALIRRMNTTDIAVGG